MYRTRLGDTTAPSISAVSVYEIVRGDPGNGGLGRICLTASATDDMTPPGQCEYQLVVIGGQLPKGFIPPTGPIHSKEYFADGRELEMLTLRWDDGRDATQDAFDFQIMLYAIDRAGYHSPPSDTVRVEHSGSYIDILFAFGVRARNRLDTAHGIFIKDMVSDPPLTLDLTLTEGEREQVLAKATETGFFDLPRVVTPDSSSCRRFPCGTSYPAIRAGNKRHGVSWDNCGCWEKESLKELSRMIMSMIMSKETYKRSPEPTSGYL